MKTLVAAPAARCKDYSIARWAAATASCEPLYGAVGDQSACPHTDVLRAELEHARG